MCYVIGVNRLGTDGTDGMNLKAVDFLGHYLQEPTQIEGLVTLNKEKLVETDKN
jgi:hypothetical protein